MTSKIHHHDRNGHITRNFFHCPALISPLAKVMDLQIWERKGPFYFLTNKIILGIEKAFSMTAMVILLISLITFIIGNMKLLVLANKLVFVVFRQIIFSMGRPQKTNLFAKSNE